jgi:thioredoxin 1
VQWVFVNWSKPNGTLLAITIVPNNMNVINITNKEDFDKEIIKGAGLQIVRFCAQWSGPCQMMGPIYQEMYDLYNRKVTFYKVDVDEVPAIKMALGIKELPTMFFYKNGNIIDFSIGMISRYSLSEKIEDALKN